MKVFFYKVNDEYGCFSNFSSYGFEIDKQFWLTSEHYFQAQKFAGTNYEEQIRRAVSPMEAAIMGRDRNKPLRTDWEEVKDDVMRLAVLSKFTTNNDIQEILLSTGNKIIVEKTSNDYYWGCGKDGSGKNMLGKILMEVRDQLRNNISN
ncbi:NADAR domain-containing protein [Bacillus carboniphilus]|uniref:NADAR domain-containing protein n=1 Tax=Bacillus carboniphilus TaxID=86663 RepID=A0ABY9JQP0_9BACI|nr:NADAR domain-containing protein [Bacillus carboniphilus]WLR41721.1 NADAR domain-containing protein [Bacillus carboniphilus]